MTKRKNLFYFAAAFLAGLINGLVGAGGGMLIVPALYKIGLNRQQAHATSVAVILPICALSAIIYITNQKVQIIDAVPYVLWGAVGAVLGAAVLKKINPELLRKIFGVFMVIAAVQLLLR